MFINRFTRIVVLLALLVALTGVTLLNFDEWFEGRASKEANARNLPVSTVNSIKHAYAASATYELLRSAWFGSDLSVDIVILLGKLNELVEVIIKFPGRHDNTLEMMKDMRNNLVGVLGAQWQETNGTEKESRLNLIGRLAQDNILTWTSEDIMLPDPQKKIARETYNVLVASEWFDENREAMTGDIKHYLYK